MSNLELSNTTSFFLQNSIGGRKQGHNINLTADRLDSHYLTMLGYAFKILIKISLHTWTSP